MTAIPNADLIDELTAPERETIERTLQRLAVVRTNYETARNTHYEHMTACETALDSVNNEIDLLTRLLGQMEGHAHKGN